MNKPVFRVVQVHRDRYLVRNGEKELYCVSAGSLRYRDEYPVAGDYVEITENPYGDSLILAVRRAELCSAGRTGAATRTDLSKRSGYSR